MKIKILIVTAFITNIAFASSLPIDTRETKNTQEIKINNKNTKTLANTVSAHLYNKGLDEDVANEKVSKALVGDEVTSDLMAMNLLHHFPQLKHKDVIAYVSKCALFNKSVDLSAHDDILSLMQQSCGLIIDKKALEKIEQVKSENKYIRLLQG